MPVPGLEHLAALLEGYCDPVAKKWAINGNAIGENGLTLRTRSVIVLNAILQRMIDPKNRKKYTSQFFETYPVIIGTVRSSWSGEFLRLMDKPRTMVKGVPRENLTVRLLHERFQAETLIPQVARDRERALFDGLNVECKACKVELFRNRSFSHIDLIDNIRDSSPHGSGSINELTMLLRSWYAFAGETIMGVEPRFVTEAAGFGANFFEQLREMMVVTRRQRRNAVVRSQASNDVMNG
jgi:hypothetical protein